MLKLFLWLTLIYILNESLIIIRIYKSLLLNKKNDARFFVIIFVICKKNYIYRENLLFFDSVT